MPVKPEDDVLELERSAEALVGRLAFLQQELATRGEYPLRQNWVEAAARLLSTAHTRRSRLRVAGISNLSDEVLGLVSEGVAHVRNIEAALSVRHGHALTTQQIHRALHQLTSRGSIERIAPSTYAMTEKGKT